MSKHEIFGISFQDLSLHSLVDKCISGALNNKIIVTPNVDHIVRAHNDTSFLTTYMKADIFVNDSRILRLIAKLCLKPIKYLVPGSDLTEALFNELHHNKTSVCIIGGESKVIQIVKKKYNGKHIQHYNPPMGFDKSDAEIEKCILFCKHANADIYFLAVGSPRQEMLAVHLRENNIGGCYLCIGASILFLSGEETRAPKLIQKLCLEWLFRLLQNPRRMAKRYLVHGIKIIPIFFNEFKSSFIYTK